MGDVFVWTGFKAERKLMVNTERIVFMECFIGDTGLENWVITLDNGEELKLGHNDGHSLMIKLSGICRPSPPIQYRRPEETPKYPRSPIRRRAGYAQLGLDGELEA